MRLPVFARMRIVENRKAFESNFGFQPERSREKGKSFHAMLFSGKSRLSSELLGKRYHQASFSSTWESARACIRSRSKRMILYSSYCCERVDTICGCSDGECSVRLLQGAAFMSMMDVRVELHQLFGRTSPLSTSRQGESER